MRAPLLMLLPMALLACAPPVPDSAASVGRQDYNAYLREREAAALRPQPIVPPGFSTDIVGAAIDRAEGGATLPAPLSGPGTGLGTGLGTGPSTGAVIGAAPIGGANSSIRPRGNAPLTIREESGEMVQAQKPGISDEQDFQAVSQRETIESDRARIERNRTQYQVIQPGAVPIRPGALGPNIVDYALATNHPVGAQLYRRSSFGGNGGARCAGYASPDLAQEAFLAKGGPERDRLGLDPDGDGYACGWDPSPFRLR